MVKLDAEESLCCLRMSFYIYSGSTQSQPCFYRSPEWTKQTRALERDSPVSYRFICHCSWGWDQEYFTGWYLQSHRWMSLRPAHKTRSAQTFYSQGPKANSCLLFCYYTKMILRSKVALINWLPLTRLCDGSGSGTCHVASYQLLSLVTAQHVISQWVMWPHMTLHCVIPHDTA